MNNLFLDKQFILTRVDFDKCQNPRWKLADLKSEEILNFSPNFEEKLTIKIDLSQRFCIGWHNLETGEDFVCPDKIILEKKYTQCPKCQQRTGFNPAFYNVDSSEVSSQQQIRNSQPHFVYLAYFSDEIIKVGISFSGRGIARLLEQGARAALILGEFSSANIARSYEEKISKMPEFCENVKASGKLKTLEQKFDFKIAEKKLLAAREKIEQIQKVNFEKNQPLNLDRFYMKDNSFLPKEVILAIDCAQSDNFLIFSGILKAQIGYILLAEQQNEIIALPLRKFIGYKIKFLSENIELELPKRQTSLFDF